MKFAIALLLSVASATNIQHHYKKYYKKKNTSPKPTNYFDWPWIEDDILDMCANVDYDYEGDDWAQWAWAIPNFFVCGVKLQVDPDDS